MFRKKEERKFFFLLPAIVFFGWWMAKQLPHPSRQVGIESTARKLKKPNSQPTLTGAVVELFCS